MNQWLLGYPEQAVQRSHEALRLAQEIAHPFSVAHALGGTARMHQFRREVQTVQERAEANLALATEHGFSYNLAMGTIFRGWALAVQGHGEEGLTQIHQGLAAYRAIGAEIVLPHVLALLAETYGQAGQPEAGLAVLAEALGLVDKTGERFREAELTGSKGSCCWPGLQTISRRVKPVCIQPSMWPAASRPSPWNCGQR
jgi:predicted ATPase